MSELSCERCRNKGEGIYFYTPTSNLCSECYNIRKYKNYDYEYEVNNIEKNWQYPQGGIKCKNFILCCDVLPEWWVKAKGSYLCLNCDMSFGKWKNGKGYLPITKDLECPICFEIKDNISLPFCNHNICIDCFKQCFSYENEKGPEFPYPEEIGEKYDKGYNRLELFREYPLLEQYEIDCEEWEDKRTEKYENSENLRKCPICRK